MTSFFVFGGLLGVAIVSVIAALVAFRDADDSVAEAKKWERRARAAGWCPVITPEKATRIMRDLFPRPMGAPSVVEEVGRLREWREHRAVKGIDHHTRHWAEGVTDSECAREILVFCIGSLEVDE